MQYTPEQQAKVDRVQRIEFAIARLNAELKRAKEAAGMTPEIKKPKARIPGRRKR